MTTPTPTTADKRAAKRIIGVYAEFDLESMAQTERIIAEEMAGERDALRLAKEAGYDAVARLNELTRVYEEQYGTSGTIDFYETIENLKSALAAIEKVEG